MIQAMVAGYLGGDGELRHMQDGTAVLEMSVAHKGRAKQGEQAPTEWVRVKVWGQRGQALAENGFAQKGRYVTAVGALELERYTGQNGPAAKLSMRADNVDFGPQVDGPGPQQPQQGGYQGGPPPQQQRFAQPPPGQQPAWGAPPQQNYGGPPPQQNVQQAAQQAPQGYVQQGPPPQQQQGFAGPGYQGPPHGAPPPQNGQQQPQRRAMF